MSACTTEKRRVHDRAGRGGAGAAVQAGVKRNPDAAVALSHAPFLPCSTQFERMNTIARENARQQREKVEHGKAAFEHKWFGKAMPEGGSHR